MADIGLNTPKSGTATTMAEALAVHADIGAFPNIIRPAFTLGGTGGGIAYNMDEFQEIVTAGITASLTNQVLIERSLLGWKEYELEVMRDLADNVVIICSIENVDPMGVHTGDSITVAPAQTLTDKEYQRLRDASVAIIREMGVECGGSNVQVGGGGGGGRGGRARAVAASRLLDRPASLPPPPDGGQPGQWRGADHRDEPARVALVRARVQGDRVPDCQDRGQTRGRPHPRPNPQRHHARDASLVRALDRLRWAGGGGGGGRKQGETKDGARPPAFLSPSVVTKIPRFAFEKFPGAKAELTTQMKSVGEAMAMGRTFCESFQKATRSLETGLDGWSLPSNWKRMTKQALEYGLRVPNPERMLVIKQAMEVGHGRRGGVGARAERRALPVPAPTRSPPPAPSSPRTATPTTSCTP